MLKSVLYYLICIVILLTACKDDPYYPKKFLSKEDQQKLIRESVYYSMKLPPNANHETKFNSEFDWYYDRAAKEVELLKFYRSAEGTNYFFMSRVARSITPMREGIGGIVALDSQGKLSAYQEIFRTWKMPADTLNVKGAMLFDRMVHGKDLSLFYSKFQGDKFIEFPNERFSFDKKAQLWHDNALDSISIE